jgi:hypothetical protein
MTSQLKQLHWLLPSRTEYAKFKDFDFATMTLQELCFCMPALSLHAPARCCGAGLQEAVISRASSQQNKWVLPNRSAFDYDRGKFPAPDADNE